MRASNRFQWGKQMAAINTRQRMLQPIKMTKVDKKFTPRTKAQLTALLGPTAIPDPSSKISGCCADATYRVLTKLQHGGDPKTVDVDVTFADAYGYTDDTMKWFTAQVNVVLNKLLAVEGMPPVVLPLAQALVQKSSLTVRAYVRAIYLQAMAYYHAKGILP